MATLVTLWADAGTQIDINATSITHTITKDVTPYHDSDGVNRWREDNRYVESWTISGTVTLADKEDLTACAKIVTGGTYPKLRVYDKTAADYYTDYSPVRILMTEDHRVADDEYQVTVKAAR
jgi:hypothetical protein